MKNKAKDLYNHLFETLESLKDKDDPMPIERAQAISLVAGKIIEVAKVEVAFLKVTGADSSPEFFDVPAEPPLRPQFAAGARSRP